MTVEGMQSDAQDNLLIEGYDTAQVDMMSEQVILVDESDQLIGPMSKVDAHRGEGVLHRAFSILLFDDNESLLMQKRASHKITFPDVWANTVCSHPLYIDNEIGTDELGSGSKIAAVRKMEQELGIPIGTIQVENIHLITRMLYMARADETWTEHELDHILFARAPNDMELNVNINEISETIWVSQSDLEEWLSEHPTRRGIIAPWFRLIAENILPEWWGNLDGLPSLADQQIRHFGDVSMVTDRKSVV